MPGCNLRKDAIQFNRQNRRFLSAERMETGGNYAADGDLTE